MCAQGTSEIHAVEISVGRGVLNGELREPLNPQGIVLFPEPGVLEHVAALAADWFASRLPDDSHQPGATAHRSWTGRRPDAT